MKMNEKTKFYLYRASLKHIDTGEELAERMGITYPTLQKRMEHPRLFTGAELLRLTELTGITLEEMFEKIKKDVRGV